MEDIDDEVVHKIFKNIEEFEAITQHKLIWSSQDLYFECLNCNNKFSSFRDEKGIAVVGTCSCILKCDEVIIQDIIK